MRAAIWEEFATGMAVTRPDDAGFVMLPRRMLKNVQVPVPRSSCTRETSSTCLKVGLWPSAGLLLCSWPREILLQELKCGLRELIALCSPALWSWLDASMEERGWQSINPAHVDVSTMKTSILCLVEGVYRCEASQLVPDPYSMRSSLQES